VSSPSLSTSRQLALSAQRLQEWRRTGAALILAVSSVVLMLIVSRREHRTVETVAIETQSISFVNR